MGNWYWLLKPYRRGLTWTFALVVVEQAAWLVEPGVFGKVIDALVAHHDNTRSFEHLLVHLSTWLSIFVVNSLAGVVRRASVARVSTQMYSGVVLTLAERAQREGEPPERTAARAELSRELVEFFETRMPMLIAGVMNVVGALIALYTFDTRIATTCLTLALPLAVVNRVVHRRIAPLEQASHDGREASFAVFASKDPEQIRAHFGQLATTRRRIASLTNVNFASLRAALLLVFVMVLYIAIDIDDFTTGNLYAVVSYLWTFVSYAEDLPQMVESGASLSDLIRRLSSQKASDAQAA